jgi:hypothetical protein
MYEEVRVRARFSVPVLSCTSHVTEIWNHFPDQKAGEKIRLAYEKKCALLRSQDANGAEPFAIEKTRFAIRDLRTKLDISLTSVDAVSRRIAAVRDDELLPQLTQLVRG